MYFVKYGDVHQKVLALEKYEPLLKEENTLARHDYKIWIKSLDHLLYIIQIPLFRALSAQEPW